MWLPVQTKKQSHERWRGLVGEKRKRRRRKEGGERRRRKRERRRKEKEEVEKEGVEGGCHQEWERHKRR